MFLKKGKFLKGDKSQIWKLAGIFFAGMILFTLLSRAAYQHGTAVVNTESPKSGVIAHNVRITGKTVQNQELAVTTVGGLRIGGVYVNEGQQVRAGDVLFTLDPEYLAQTILTQEMEMEKQKLSIQGTWSQDAARQKQRANQLSQAEENYAIAVGRAETTLERAGRTLERAQKALENFYNGVTQEGTLRDALEQAQEDYQSAQTALEQLQEEIENRVQEAMEQAQQQSTQPLPSEPEPLPSEPEPLPSEPEPLPTETEPLPTETEPLPMETEPISTETEPLPTQTEPISIETEPAVAELSPVPAEETLFYGEPGIRLVFLSEITLPDLAEVEAAVREQYAQQLADAQAEVERTRVAMETAQAELDSCQNGTGSAPTEQELLDALEKAQEGYDDALTALNNAKTTYGRAVASAGLPDGGDNSARIGQIKYDQMTLTLDDLEALQAAEGKILSPMDGIVTQCNVQTGQKTTDTTAVLLADLSLGCKFTGVATQEQSKYIGVGDKVTLRFDSTGKEYKDLPVTTFSTTEEKEGGFRLTVQLPADLAALGAGAELRFTRKSQPYNCCVPLSALHLDSKNQAYVLVVEPVATVLGTQMQARKVPVTVLEQNETMAALADGSLHREQQVIVSSDRAVDAGSRVRVA